MLSIRWYSVRNFSIKNQQCAIQIARRFYSHFTKRHVAVSFEATRLASVPITLIIWIKIMTVSAFRLMMIETMTLVIVTRQWHVWWRHVVAMTQWFVAHDVMTMMRVFEAPVRRMVRHLVRLVSEMTLLFVDLMTRLICFLVMTIWAWRHHLVLVFSW